MGDLKLLTCCWANIKRSLIGILLNDPDWLSWCSSNVTILLRLLFPFNFLLLLFTAAFCDWLVPEVELNDLLFPEPSLVELCTITFTPGDKFIASFSSTLMGVANGALGGDVVAGLGRAVALSPFLGLLKSSFTLLRLANPILWAINRLNGDPNRLYFRGEILDKTLGAILSYKQKNAASRGIVRVK